MNKDAPYSIRRVTSNSGATPHWRIDGPGCTDADVTYGDSRMCIAVCNLMNRAYKLGIMDQEETKGGDHAG